MKQHSPAPWHKSKNVGYFHIQDKDGYIAVDVLNEQDADLIITAVNNHDRLVEALRKAEIGLMNCYPLQTYDMKTLHIVRAALAAAEVK